MRSQAVLLCAEDDDLELVALVHLAQQNQVELEVVSGVEHDDEPVLEALDSEGGGLFILVRSPNMPQHREGQIAATFALAARENQDLISMRADVQDPRTSFEHISRQLAARGLSPQIAQPPHPCAVPKVAAQAIEFDPADVHPAQVDEPVLMDQSGLNLATSPHATLDNGLDTGLDTRLPPPTFGMMDEEQVTTMFRVTPRQTTRHAVLEGGESATAMTIPKRSPLPFMLGAGALALVLGGIGLVHTFSNQAAPPPAAAPAPTAEIVETAVPVASGSDASPASVEGTTEQLSLEYNPTKSRKGRRKRAR